MKKLKKRNQVVQRFSAGRLSDVAYGLRSGKVQTDWEEQVDLGLADKYNVPYNIPSVKTVQFDNKETQNLRDVYTKVVGKDKWRNLGFYNSFWVESFEYDTNGNRESKTNAWGTILYEYNAANEMTKAGNCTYTYDANGNRITAESTNESSEYEYNATNRLSQVTRDRGTGVATYSYDALGRRSRKGSGSEYEGYLYDGLSFETAGVYRLDSGSEDKYDNLVKEVRTPSVQAPVVDGYNPLWGSHRELEGGATVLEEHQWVAGSILAVRGEGNYQLTYQHHDD